MAKLDTKNLCGFYIDIEADNLYILSTKIWYMRFKSLDGSRSIKILPFQEDYEVTAAKVQDWIDSFPDGSFVVGHNILGYDTWMLWKFLGIKPRVGKKNQDTLGGKHVQFIDTLVLSQYLQPDVGGHSLEYLSEGNEEEKIKYREKLVEAGVMVGNEPKGHEFSFYHPLMEEYCDQDVDSGIEVFKDLWAKALEMYKDKWIHKSYKQVQKDFFLYAAQAYSGVYFHKKRAEELAASIEKMMDEIKTEVDPLLPPRPLKKAEEAFYKIPAKPWTKSGEFSANMVKWMEKHNATVEEKTIYAYGRTFNLIANEILDVKLPMEIDDNVELKQYFLDSGWVPHEDFWNFKRDERGKPARDERGQIIKTTPKIQHAGQICPNLLELEADTPKKVVKYLSLRNRLSIIRGWLKNWRIEFDGRLSAEITGYTPTFRVKHSTVVNVPKADPKVLLGAEMRDLFGVEEGFHYVGTDAASLEARTVAAYTMKYDGGKFAELVLEKDIHTANAFAFFPHIYDLFDPNEPGLKDKKEFKPYRNKAKTGQYLLSYGGGVGKLASSLGLSKAEAQLAYDNYWIANEGLGKLKTNIEAYYNTTGKKKFAPAWDGRILNIRGKNVLINCVGQSLGAICMSIAACMMDARLGELYLDDKDRPYYYYKGKIVRRISLIHDEYSWEVEDGIEEEIRQMSVDCIIKAGEYLELPLPLDGEGKIGKTWKDVH